MERYGVTLEEYERWIEAAAGVCPLCVKAVELLVLDHDHESGEIRGAICSPCNRVLGHAYDDPETLERAAAYLRRSKTKMSPSATSPALG